MTDTAATFIAKSTIKAPDLLHRRTINFNIGRYNAAVPAGKQQFDYLMLARERAKNRKWLAIESLHKSKEDVAKLFADKFGTSPTLTPEQLTLFARKQLREKYTKAEVGVTGANFIIADIGAVAVSENEGNARLSCAWPKTHIVVVGI